MSNDKKILVIFLILLYIIYFITKYHKEHMTPDINTLYSDNKYQFYSHSKELINSLLNDKEMNINNINCITNLSVSNTSKYYDILYPVGSVIILYNDKTPMEYGYSGDWEKLSGGRVLSSTGVYKNDDIKHKDITTADKYGQNEVILKAHNVSNHNHNMQIDYKNGYGKKKKNIFVLANYFIDGKSKKITKKSKKRKNKNKFQDWTSKGTYDENGNATLTDVVAHENMPAYVIVNVWERTK